MVGVGSIVAGTLLINDGIGNKIESSDNGTTNETT